MKPPDIAFAKLSPSFYRRKRDGALRTLDYELTEHMIEADGVEFDCPGCVGTERSHRLRMPFFDRNEDLRVRWHQRGTSLADLTFVDGPDGYTRSLRVLGYPCHSHFNITRGVVDHYEDSHSP